MVIARQVASQPENFAGGGVYAAGAVAAEMDVEPAFLDHRRRAGVAVIRMAICRSRVGEQLHVMDDFSRLPVHADSEEFLAVSAGSGHPNLIAPDNGRRPALVVN